MMTMTVEVSGPIYDGRGEEILDRFCAAAADHIADEGEKRVKERLNQVLMHPEGTYVEHVRHEGAGTSHRVNDSNIVYGPWLEGESRRNQSTPYKGRHTFRLVGAELERDAVRLAEEVLPPFLAELGGGA
jgi:hypothetical protein